MDEFSSLIKQCISAKCQVTPNCTVVTPAWIKRAAYLAYISLQRLSGGSVDWRLGDVERVIYKSYHASVEAIAYFKSLEQRSEAWHQLRNGWVDKEAEIYRCVLVSSSTAAKAWRHYEGYILSDYKLISETIHGDDSAASRFSAPEAQIRMQRGTAMECRIMPMTETVIERDVRLVKPNASVVIREVGLQIWREGPYIGVSSDGEVIETDAEKAQVRKGGIEMKCRGLVNDLPYDVIKTEYFDQVQLTQAVLSMPEYTFVCHSAQAFAHEYYKFDAKQWSVNALILERFYWQRLWPCFVLKQMGLIEAPSCLPHMSIMSLPVIQRHYENILKDESHETLLLPNQSTVIAAWDAFLHLNEDAINEQDGMALEPPNKIRAS